MKFIRQTAWYGSAVTIAAIMAVALLFAGPADEAQAAAAISTAADAAPTMDTNVASGDGTYTNTAALVIDENVIADIKVGTTVLDAPTGWEFNTASIPDAVITVADGGGTFAFAATPVAVTATTITITTTALSTTDANLQITIGGVTPIQVRPLTALAASLDITYDDTASTGGLVGVADGATVGTLTATDPATADQFAFILSGAADVGTTLDAAAGAVIELRAVIDAAGQSVNWSTDGGTFSQTGSTASIFSVDGSLNDLTTSTAPRQVGVVLQLPASGVVVVTVTPTGATESTTLTITIPTAATVMDAKTPSSPSLDTAGNESIISADLQDADSNGIDATITVITTLGGFLSTSVGVCDSGETITRQSCTIESDGVATDSSAVGTVEVTLVHGGVSGTATVTFLSGSITDTATVTFTGVATTAVAVIDDSYILQATTGTATITVTVTDDSGSAVADGTLVYPTVSSGTVKVSVASSVCEVTGTTDGECTIAITAGATSTLGAQTIDLRFSAGTAGDIEATATVNVVLAADSITTDAPTSVAEGSTTEITITVLDADGNPAPDGIDVTVASTGNAIIIGQTVTINDGSGTFELVATQGGGSVIIALTTTGVDTVLLTVTVGDAVAETTTPGDATAFTAPPAGGLSPGVTGTTDFQALIDAQTFTVVAIWKLDIGTQTFQSYIPGGLDIANSLSSIAATDIVFLKSE